MSIKRIHHDAYCYTKSGGDYTLEDAGRIVHLGMQDVICPPAAGEECHPHAFGVAEDFSDGEVSCMVGGGISLTARIGVFAFWLFAAVVVVGTLRLLWLLGAVLVRHALCAAGGHA